MGWFSNTNEHADRINDTNREFAIPYEEIARLIAHEVERKYAQLQRRKAKESDNDLKFAKILANLVENYHALEILFTLALAILIITILCWCMKRKGRPTTRQSLSPTIYNKSNIFKFCGDIVGEQKSNLSVHTNHTQSNPNTEVTPTSTTSRNYNSNT